MVKRPKISFVVGLRNPEYGLKNGMNNLYRTQLFVENLIFLCNKYRLSSELIFVEWNPVNSGEFFQKIKWPSLGIVTVRWIEVPPEIHKKFLISLKIPIYEFIAKNVGICRAKGDYILSTNVDVLYSEPLMKYLTKVKLSTNCFYRVDRLDVAGYISSKMSFSKRLNYCNKHIVKIHTFYGSVSPNEIAYNQPILNFFKKRELIIKYWIGNGLFTPADGLHRNAAGDFFLMARKRWYQLRGYAELCTHSHIDSIICWQAATLNLKQVILNEKYKLYHIDHDRKIHQSCPKTDWRKWYSMFQKYKSMKKVLLVNNKNWGLKSHNLKSIFLN